MWGDVKNSNFGEKMLWVTVLRRSIFDYILYKDNESDSNFLCAKAFIFDGEKIESGVTFDEICDVFLWDPDYIRRLVVDMDRSSVRRLKIVIFRDEFVTEGYNPIAPSVVSKWDSVNSSVPFFLDFAYSKDYKHLVKLRSIDKSKSFSTPPVGVF